MKYVINSLGEYLIGIKGNSLFWGPKKHALKVPQDTIDKLQLINCRYEEVNS